MANISSSERQRGGFKAGSGSYWNVNKGNLFYSEHRRAVERLIEERRAQFQREKEAELEERREEERREAARRAIIEQERQRLLREHASKLLGYLPKVRVWHAFMREDGG